MKRTELYDHLLELARQHFDRVEISPGDFRSSVCRVRGESCLILNKNATLDQNLRTLAEALMARELGDRFILPAIREAMEKYTDVTDPS